MKYLLHTLIIILCIILISICSFSYLYLNRTSNELLQTISTLDKSVEENNWILFKKQSTTLKNQWTSLEPLWAVFIDHHEIESIEADIDKLYHFEKYGEPDEISITIIELTFWISHIPKIEKLTWENIF